MAYLFYIYTGGCFVCLFFLFPLLQSRSSEVVNLFFGRCMQNYLIFFFNHQFTEIDISKIETIPKDIFKHILKRGRVFSFKGMWICILIFFQRVKRVRKWCIQFTAEWVTDSKISNIQLLLLQLMHISVSADKREAQITRRSIRQQRNAENETIAKKLIK